MWLPVHHISSQCSLVLWREIAKHSNKWKAGCFSYSYAMQWEGSKANHIWAAYKAANEVVIAHSSLNA